MREPVSPPLGNDTHGGSTTKQCVGEEAGKSYWKTSFFPDKEVEVCPNLAQWKPDDAYEPRDLAQGNLGIPLLLW